MRHLLIYIKKLREFAGFKLYVNLIGMTVISFLEGIGIFLLVPALGLIGIFHMDTSGIPFVSYLVGPLQAIPEGMRSACAAGRVHSIDCRPGPYAAQANQFEFGNSTRIY